ncbi:MAG: hypothetical protein CMF74_00445 [Maricaulis sp.]|jgi:hypothetical protein|nr:hypothetical protein [Maricaulis sp.]
MASQIHYEVFIKKNRKAGWTLAEARENREDAITLAETLLNSLPDGSVRVSKEQFVESTRKFRSFTVMEKGADKYALAEEKTGDASLPCLTPDDLSNAAARDTIRRTLSQWLERQQATPMELLHRPDLVETLESGGTEMQHAIQKVALASAREGDANVHAYTRQLQDLTGRALTRIYQDGRAKKLPRFPVGQSFAGMVEKICAKPNVYKLRAAMADRLSEERSYRDKLACLIGFTEDLPADAELREIALTETDAFMGEILGFDSGISSLLGDVEDLGGEIQRLADIYCGRPDAEELAAGPAPARQLAAMVKEFPAARTAIAQRLLAQLRKPRRMKPDCVATEVKLARALAQQLVLSCGPDLPADQLQEAFSQRSARLLTPETISDYIEDAEDANEEIARLLALEENIVGAQNKKKLAGYVRACLGAHRTESWFTRGPGNALDRLSRLASHQKRAMRGHYPEEELDDLAGTFDALGRKVLESSNLLDQVASSDRPVLDRVTSLLRLASTGVLPVGFCTTDAKERAMKLLRSDAGNQEVRDITSQAKLGEIESLIKSMAA